MNGTESSAHASTADAVAGPIPLSFTAGSSALGMSSVLDADLSRAMASRVASSTVASECALAKLSKFGRTLPRVIFQSTMSTSSFAVMHGGVRARTSTVNRWKNHSSSRVSFSWFSASRRCA